MKPPTRVDPATHRLFISRGTHFMVVDLAQGKIVGDIPETHGAHGVAFAAEFNRGYTTNGRTADSTIFDMAKLKVLGNVKTDKDTDGVIYDPFSKRVFTFNGDANTATAPTVWDPHRRCLPHSMTGFIRHVLVHDSL